MLRPTTNLILPRVRRTLLVGFGAALGVSTVVNIIGPVERMNASSGATLGVTRGGGSAVLRCTPGTALLGA